MALGSEAIPLAVFGGRGGGQLLVDTARRGAGATRITPVGYLNDREPAGSTIDGVPVLGPFESWAALPPETRFAAPLHAHGDMRGRVARIEGLGIPGERWLTVADPTSLFIGSVEVGAGSFFAAYSVCKANVRIGKHVAIRDLASIGHDVEIGDFVFIGTSAMVAGYSRIGRGVYIAPGAIVRDRVTVGAFATVGIGAVVTRDVPDGATVVGNPARQIKTEKVP